MQVEWLINIYLLLPTPTPLPKHYTYFVSILHSHASNLWTSRDGFFLALKPFSSQGKSFVKILYSKNWMYTCLYSMYVWFIKCRLISIFKLLCSVEVACLVGYLRFVGSIPCCANSMLPCIIVHVYIYIDVD